MSRHWRPDRSEGTALEDYDSAERRSRGGVVPTVVSATLIGLILGGALSWTARNASSQSGPTVEWQASRSAPAR